MIKNNDGLTLTYILIKLQSVCIANTDHGYHMKVKQVEQNNKKSCKSNNLLSS